MYAIGSQDFGTQPPGPANSKIERLSKFDISFLALQPRPDRHYYLDCSFSFRFVVFVDDQDGGESVLPRCKRKNVIFKGGEADVDEVDDNEERVLITPRRLLYQIVTSGLV